jgi:hypothetical protein
MFTTAGVTRLSSGASDGRGDASAATGITGCASIRADTATSAAMTASTRYFMASS